MKKLSESIWSDMQDRSSGQEIRKEDDNNNLRKLNLTLKIIKRKQPK